MIPIAHIETPYASKFGVPRQSGLVAVPSRIVFEPDYRIAEAVRGMEQFSHLWLLWQFHLVPEGGFRPTVRPPRLGGNKRVGVFATRSPFRPNPIGLSVVRLLRIDMLADLGPVLYLEGADLVNGTPILDIKPYLPYTDSHPDAVAGFASSTPAATLAVNVSPDMLALLPPDLHQPLIDTLAHDPRPAYQHDPSRLYTLVFSQWQIRFAVADKMLTVVDISPAPLSPIPTVAVR